MPAAIVKYMKEFCERHLIAEDPYQYEHLTIDQLVDVKIRNSIQKWKSPALENEIKKRLEYENLNYEQTEILTKSLEWK